MFDLDTWQEIASTVRQNKLRTFLTGFSVAWGIFMLVILLGSGEGLANGIEYQFRDDAINSIWVGSGQTSRPYKGLRPGRDVQFTNRDHSEVESTVDGVEHITSRFYVRSPQVTRGSEYGSFDVRSVHPAHQYLENTLVTRGRFLNELDIRQGRKVAAIGILAAEELFGDQDAIGEYIEVNGVPFRVVGLFEDAGGENEMTKIYLPITTAQRTFNGADRVAQIMYTTGEASVPVSEQMADETRQLLATRHSFHPEDERAVWVRNNNAFFERFVRMMSGIRLFIWIVGIGTILAGVVGVSNIMMIAVRERTREIGVRKALGATPGSVIGLVLQESLLVTAIAGYTGLVLGVGLLEFFDRKILPAEGYFIHPQVDLRIALAATVVLVVSGTLAGLVPAMKAARIRPIEALRDE